MLATLVSRGYLAKHNLLKGMLSMSDFQERGRAGGQARAEALPAETKKAIAQKAALARWGAAATHRGNFKEDFGIDVDCYVLNDAAKTAVISQRGMGAVFGLTTSGQAFNRFVAGKTMAAYLGAEIREKIQKPLKFQWAVPGVGRPPGDIYGYDVTLLIDVCKAIVQAEADRKLQTQQANIARQAHIVINACAKSGIQNLVYRLAGYDATKQEVIAAFKFYVREEAREYEREFPEELYTEWYRLYQLPRPERNRPWKFKHLTEEQVWKPLARSNGRIFEMAKERREETNKRHSRLHQFLSEIGVKALRVHLGKLTGIANVSSTKDEYERHFKKVFGQQLEMFD
jgi:hypothetical protein